MLPRGKFGGSTVVLWTPVARSDIAWNFVRDAGATERTALLMVAPLANSRRALSETVFESRNGRDRHRRNSSSRRLASRSSATRATSTRMRSRATSTPSSKGSVISAASSTARTVVMIRCQHGTPPSQPTLMCANNHRAGSPCRSRPCQRALLRPRRRDGRPQSAILASGRA